jgi:hypothetical protein
MRVLQVASYIVGGLFIAAIVVIAAVGLLAIWVEKTFGQGGR